MEGIMFGIIYVFILLSVSLNAEDHSVGDMILDDYQFYQFTNKRNQIDSSVGFLSSGRSGEQYRWPNGELPYDTFRLNQQQKRVLEDVSRIKESDERVVEANERAGGESRYESQEKV